MWPAVEPSDRTRGVAALSDAIRELGCVRRNINIPNQSGLPFQPSTRFLVLDKAAGISQARTDFSGCVLGNLSLSDRPLGAVAVGTSRYKGMTDRPASWRDTQATGKRSGDGTGGARKGHLSLSPLWSGG